MLQPSAEAGGGWRQARPVRENEGVELRSRRVRNEAVSAPRNAKERGPEGTKNSCRCDRCAALVVT